MILVVKTHKPVALVFLCFCICVLQGVLIECSGCLSPPSSFSPAFLSYPRMHQPPPPQSPYPRCEGSVGGAWGCLCSSGSPLPVKLRRNSTCAEKHQDARVHTKTRRTLGHSLSVCLEMKCLTCCFCFEFECLDLRLVCSSLCS